MALRWSVIKIHGMSSFKNLNNKNRLEAEVISKKNPIKRFFWFLCGIESERFQILDGPYICERKRYTSIGLAMATMTFLALISFTYAFLQILYPDMPLFQWQSVVPWIICLVFSFVVTLIFFNLQRFVLTISNSVIIQLDSGGGRLTSGYVGTLLSAMMSIAVGVPLQTMIMSPSIEVAMLSNRVSYDLKIDTYLQNRTGEMIQLLNRWDELQRYDKVKNDLLVDSDFKTGCERTSENCIEELRSKLRTLGNDLDNDKSLTSTQKIKNLYEIEMLSAQLVNEQEKSKLQKSLGFLKRSSLGFEAEPFFSWMIILIVIFLQATPGVARMFSHPSAFDYAKVEGDRLAIAKMGIELEAEFIFDVAGNPIPVDKFHVADRIFSQEMVKVQQEINHNDQENSLLKDKKSEDISQYAYSLKT